MPSIPKGLGLLFVFNVTVAGSIWLLAARNRTEVEEIQLALDRHDFETADASLQRYLQSSRADPEAHFLAAQLARRALLPSLESESGPEPATGGRSLGSRTVAEQHLRLFCRYGGDLRRARLEGQLLCAQIGELEGVESDLMDLVRNNSPESSRILEALAAGFLGRHRLRQAQSCLDEWLNRQQQPHAHLWRGFVYEQKGNPARAASDYRCCLNLAPDNVGATIRLAGVLRSTDANKAIRLYREVLRRRPHDPTALLGQACCEAKLGDSDRARATLDALLRDHPTWVRALVERARLETASGETWLQRALELAPRDLEANHLFFQCLDLAGKREAANRQQLLLDDLAADAKRLREICDATDEPLPGADTTFEMGALLLCCGREREGLRHLETAQRAKHDRATRLVESYRHRAPGCFLMVHVELAELYQRARLGELAARHERQARCLSADPP